jgi:hypothetical protein
MISVPWRTSGARLQLPRDLEIAYVAGRMGLVAIADVFPLWYGSPHTCRFGFGRLVRLGLLRRLPRPNVISPAWFSLTARGLVWTAERAGCDERELRTVASSRDFSLGSLSLRNRFWTSLILSSRRHPEICLDRFSPEWELRPTRPADVHVVPDAIVSLSRRVVTGERRCVWMVEVDNTTERVAVWKRKAAQYAELRSRGRLYGYLDWRLLAIVPSLRRACSVSVAVASSGGGAFSCVAVAGTLDGGHAFEEVVWPCSELANMSDAQPTASLTAELTERVARADQQLGSTVDRPPSAETGTITP